MSGTDASGRVRPPQVRKHLGRALIALLLTGGAIFACGRLCREPPSPPAPVEATLTCRAGDDRAAAALQQVGQQALEEAFQKELDGADYRLRLVREPDGRAMHIVVSVVDPDASHAAARLEAALRAWAGDLSKTLAAAETRRADEAAQKTERAWTEYCQARDRVDRGIETALVEVIQSAQASAVEPPPAPTAETSPAQTELAELRGKLETLRATRTPAHPDIVGLQTKIAELERQLPLPAPRRLTRELKIDPAAVEQPLQLCRKQSAEVQEAKRRFEQTAVAARLGAVASLEHEIVFAPRTIVVGNQDRAFLPWLALAGGLAAALAVAMFSFARDFDRPVTTVGELRGLLGIPVLGPIELPRAIPAHSRRRSAPERRRPVRDGREAEIAARSRD